MNRGTQSVLATATLLMMTGCSASDTRASDGDEASPRSASPSTSSTAVTRSLIGELFVARDITGALTTDGDACYSSPEYEQVAEGAQVVVSNAAGEKVALATLGAPEIAVGARCRYDLLVRDVPAGEGIYSIKIADAAGPSFAEDDMAELTVELD